MARSKSQNELIEVLEGYWPPEPHEFGAVDRGASFATLRAAANRMDVDAHGRELGIGITRAEARELRDALSALLA